MSDPYNSFDYVSAHANIGSPFWVPPWQTYVLKRSIPNSDDYDAIFVPPRAQADFHNVDIQAGLEFLRQSGLVSLVLVPDSVRYRVTRSDLSAFDFAKPFKRHYLVDNSIGSPGFTAHHRRVVRRAYKRCYVKRIDLSQYLSQWMAIWSNLIAKKNLGGEHAFPQSYFSELCAIEGMETFGAFDASDLIGAGIWARNGDLVYGHLGASSEAGYRAYSMYAIYDTAISYFSDCSLIDLGGVAGTSEETDSGLRDFKEGFANAYEISYLCGAILDRRKYESHCSSISQDTFFPAYRTPS